MKKRYGQHFLFDPNILRRIVSFSAVDSGSTVVEIGPGAGALTKALALAANRVIAIEIDRDLIAPLRAKAPANVEIVQGDALEVDLEGLTGDSFHLVGNLPYYIATPLLKRFIEHRRRILSVTVMIQKEVADRIAAAADTESYGPLSVLIQYYARVSMGFTVPPGAFRPAPKVDSAVIRLDWIPEVPDAPEFTDFVHRIFGERRKKLVNNLRRLMPDRTSRWIREQLGALEIAADARPGELSVEQFLRVYNQVGRH